MNLCEDQGFEYRRILRSMMIGEKLPPVSTYDLLNGAYHDTGGRERSPAERILDDDSRKRMLDGALRSNSSRRGKITARQAKHFETIKRLLLTKTQNSIIMEVTGLTKAQLDRDIREQKELFDIAKGRMNGNYHSIKRSEDKFLENRDAIYEALKTRSMTSVARELNFCLRTLVNHLKRDGWNESRSV